MAIRRRPPLPAPKKRPRPRPRLGTLTAGEIAAETERWSRELHDRERALFELAGYGFYHAIVEAKARVIEAQDVLNELERRRAKREAAS